MKTQLNVLVDIFKDVDMVPRRGKLKSKGDMMVFQNAAEKWKNKISWSIEKTIWFRKTTVLPRSLVQYEVWAEYDPTSCTIDFSVIQNEFDSHVIV